MAVGVPVQTTEDLGNLNRRTTIDFYQQLRLTFTHQIEERWAFAKAIEVDELYVAGRRKGKYGSGTAARISVLGTFQRGSKVYIRVIFDAKAKARLPIIRKNVLHDRIAYTHYYRCYHFSDVSELNHY